MTPDNPSAGLRCEEHGELITNQTLESPVEVAASDVTFEHCRFVSKDPQHTLLTTGERTIVRDCEFSGDYNYGARRGICVNSPGVVITTSRFRDIFHAQDAQCIAGWDGTKDLVIEDCYGEASGENFILGGADCTSEDRIPQNIQIRRCYFTKLPWWKTKPNGATIKNLLELKNAKNVLIEDCDFSFSWTDGQTGFGLVLTVRNQDGNNPYATVEDVIIKKSVFRDVEQGIQILGKDDTHPSQTMKRITLENVRVTYGSGNGVQLGNGTEGLTFNGCSFWSGTNNKWLAFNCPENLIKGLVITDTNANEGQYGILGDDSACGTPTIEKYCPDARFENVSLWRGPSGANYPYPTGITVY
jgi:hypothetical protein